MEYITGQSASQVICKAIDEYYRRVIAAATEEQLQAERNAWNALSPGYPARVAR